MLITFGWQRCVRDSPPVWFAFAGMGTQWHGMGRDLMVIDTFRESITQSNNVLLPHGVYLYEMIMNGHSDLLQDIVNSFVAIAAIQVSKR